MLPFSPKTSRLWQKAAFSLIYSSVIGITVRGAALTILLLTIVLLFDTQARLTYLATSLLVLLLMIEAFYRFKILKTKPHTLELSSKTNLADLVSFSLAKRMLAWPFWESTGHLLKILRTDPKIQFVLHRSAITNQELSEISQRDEKVSVEELMQLAASFAEKEGYSSIDELMLFRALFSKSEFLQNLYFRKELKPSDLENIIHWSKNLFPENYTPFWEGPTSFLGLGLASIWTGGWTLETEKFTRDLTLSKSHSDRYLVGRRKEVSLLQGILLREEKRNALLIGEPGIGKETIVYTLSRMSLYGQLPEELSYKRFLELDMTALSGSGNGSIEQRLKNILTEVSHAQDVILVIPQIENIAGALEGGKFDISGLLLEHLKSSLQVIGTSTRAAYHQFLETKPAFANDFEVINVSEPDTEETIRILEEAVIQMERKNKVVVTYNAVKKAVEVSQRYIIDKVLPGKAIELLDEAVTTAALARKKFLEPNDIEEIITAKTNVPAGLAKDNEKEKLSQLEKTLHERIIGQDEAINNVSQAIRRARTLKRDSLRPIGVFLFLGPTGVGKTETAKALAQVYFGSEDRIIRLDMSSFNQESSAYRLIGSPPGLSDYREGGQLTEAVRSNPFSLILLDEIEKSHPKVQEVFLSIFDEGTITDSSGRKISFTNTIIICTSNAGAEFIREEIKKSTQAESLKQNLIEKLLREGIFKPEFLNRFDGVIIYQPLLPQEVKKVVELLLKKLKERLAKQDLDLEVAPEVIAHLAEKGYDSSFGARPLQRIIQAEVEDKISEALISGKLKRGSKASFMLYEGQVYLA